MTTHLLRMDAQLGLVTLAQPRPAVMGAHVWVLEDRRGHLTVSWTHWGGGHATCLDVGGVGGTRTPLCSEDFVTAQDLLDAAAALDVPRRRLTALDGQPLSLAQLQPGVRATVHPGWGDRFPALPVQVNTAGHVVTPVGLLPLLVPEATAPLPGGPAFAACVSDPGALMLYRWSRTVPA